MLLGPSRLVVPGALALVAVALGTTGCSPSVKTEPSDDYLSTATQAQVLQSVQALNYPYESDPSYSIRMANLQTRLINDCVAKQGVVPPKVADLPLDIAAVTPAESRLWLLPGDDYGVAVALADPSVVAQLGSEEGLEPEAGAGIPDPDAYDKAVYGSSDDRIEFPLEGGGSASVPVGGCFGEATKTMYGVTDAADYERAYYAIPNIREVMTALRADDQVRAGISAWSSCMKDAGHDVGSPDDLYGAMNTWISGVVGGTMLVSTVEDQEHDLASVDRGCRTSSGLGTALSSRFLQLAESEIRGSEGAVQEYRTMIEHAQSLLATQ